MQSRITWIKLSLAVRLFAALANLLYNSSSRGKSSPFSVSSLVFFASCFTLSNSASCKAQSSKSHLIEMPMNAQVWHFDKYTKKYYTKRLWQQQCCNCTIYLFQTLFDFICKKMTTSEIPITPQSPLRVITHQHGKRQPWVTITVCWFLAHSGFSFLADRTAHAYCLSVCDAVHCGAQGRYRGLKVAPLCS